MSDICSRNQCAVKEVCKMAQKASETATQESDIYAATMASEATGFTMKPAPKTPNLKI